MSMRQQKSCPRFIYSPQFSFFAQRAVKENEEINISWRVFVVVCFKELWNGTRMLEVRRFFFNQTFREKVPERGWFSADILESIRQKNVLVSCLGPPHSCRSGTILVSQITVVITLERDTYRWQIK